MQLLIPILLACAPTLAQQAAFEGTAVNGVTGAPLKGVQVEITAMMGFRGPGMEIGDAYGALSRSDGRFSIRGIRPGTYLIMARLPGYIAAPKADSGSPIPNVTLKAGQPIGDYRLELFPRAVIIGRVLDDAGDPIARAMVQAVAASPGSAPVNVLSGGMARTNDRGEYRFSGPPGKYHVKVLPLGIDFGQPEIRTDGSADLPYNATFYPSALTADRATAVDAKAGADISGIDVRMLRGQGLSISGVVTGLPDESARPMVMLNFGESAKDMRMLRSTTCERGGRFTFSGLQPGAYRIYAHNRNGKTYLQTPARDLQIAGSSVANLDLTLAPAGDIAGTIVADSGGNTSPAAKRTVRLGLAGMGSYISDATLTAESDADGAFRMSGVQPNKYKVLVEPLTDNGYVRSMRLDGVESTGAVLDLSAGVRSSSLAITLGRNAAQISGTILDTDGAPFLNHPLMVILTNDPSRFSPDDMTRVGSGGKYEIKQVVPGKYRLYALDAFRIGGASAMDEIKNLAAKADEIEIKEGDRIVKDMKPLIKEQAGAKQKP